MTLETGVLRLALDDRKRRKKTRTGKKKVATRIMIRKLGVYHASSYYGLRSCKTLDKCDAIIGELKIGSTWYEARCMCTHMLLLVRRKGMKMHVRFANVGRYDRKDIPNA